jgi:hypothetical protein
MHIICSYSVHIFSLPLNAIRGIAEQGANAVWSGTPVRLVEVLCSHWARVNPGSQRKGSWGMQALTFGALPLFRIIIHG